MNSKWHLPAPTALQTLGQINKLQHSAKSFMTFSHNTAFSCNCCWCNPILVMTFPAWLSGTETWPCTHGAVRPSSYIILFIWSLISSYHSCGNNFKYTYTNVNWKKRQFHMFQVFFLNGYIKKHCICMENTVEVALELKLTPHG